MEGLSSIAVFDADDGHIATSLPFSSDRVASPTADHSFAVHLSILKGANVDMTVKVSEGCVPVVHEPVDKFSLVGTILCGKFSCILEFFV